jgi:glycosyltransferase involved in cell wall biosynthesis
VPKLSIITINLNNIKGLQKTFDSIFSQSGKYFEYIVVDGGSIDNSTDVIKANEDKIAFWLSEKDKGVYNAMNKGIVKASGDYLLFLNSGDHFIHDGILKEVYNDLDRDIVYGDALLVQGDTKSWRGHNPPALTFQFFVECTLPHCATFIKRPLFDKIGYYDENLLICSDWKFFIDAICRYNVSYKHIDKTISTFYLDGLSSTKESVDIIKTEKNNILQRDYPMFMQMYEELSKFKKTKNNKLEQLLAKAKSRLRKSV